MNFNTEATFDKTNLGDWGGGGGEATSDGGAALKPKQYARLWQPSTHCRACGTINISKYVNNFLRTNPTILILSSLVSEF